MFKFRFKSWLPSLGGAWTPTSRLRPDAAHHPGFSFRLQRALNSEPLIVMYATYIARRTQIYLEDEQNRLLTERSAQVGRTKSALIREAIDAYLTPASGDQRVARLRAAVKEASGAAAHLPDGARYVEELRATEGERRGSHDRRG